MAKNFNCKIKKKAIDSLFFFKNLNEEILLKTVKKETFEGYQKKVKFCFNQQQKFIKK